MTPTIADLTTIRDAASVAFDAAEKLYHATGWGIDYAALERARKARTLAQDALDIATKQEPTS